MPKCFTLVVALLLALLSFCVTIQEGSSSDRPELLPFEANYSLFTPISLIQLNPSQCLRKGIVHRLCRFFFLLVQIPGHVLFRYPGAFLLPALLECAQLLFISTFADEDLTLSLAPQFQLLVANRTACIRGSGHHLPVAAFPVLAY